ncbi:MULTISPECIES: ABC transporter substrate-binding protein [unclassified Mesorhizobium]|uniref:ABC transporter substrate-binding protein n=1 Tax=unclassified Mesorhizobium TaxID=325217 RepID=UPI0030148179
MRCLVLAASAFALMLGSAAAEGGKLKLGTEGAYPPFNYATADGKLAGFDIDIGNALCEEMKVECEFVVQDFDGSIPALQAGKFDAIINITITPERAEKVDFTHKYYQTPPAIAVPKDSPLTGATPEDLKGKVLGVQNATIHANFAEKEYAGSEVKSYPTGDDARADMANGRVDAVMDGSIILTEWLKTDAGACCKLLGTLTPDPAVHGPGVGIALQKGNKELTGKLDAAIDALRANGKYKEINDRYFSFDVYGG